MPKRIRKRFRRIDLRGDGVPAYGELGVLNRLNASAFEFAEKFGGGVVGEAEVDVGESFVENGRAEEAGHLLFFDGVAGSGDDVAAAREDCAGDLALEGSEEGELSEIESEVAVAAAELDAIGGGDFVDGGGIDAERIEGVVGGAGGVFGGGRGCGCGRRAGHHEQAKREEGHPWPHTQSVGTFGMGKQGVLRDR